ncbi:MAG: hypothetical protein KDJ35_02415 [Alphaproteobacteria bacterium]|nr:hypothetical protein [Alphaproteobacteria bacterium]
MVIDLKSTFQGQAELHHHDGSITATFTKASQDLKPNPELQQELAQNIAKPTDFNMN